MRPYSSNYLIKVRVIQSPRARHISVPLTQPVRGLFSAHSLRAISSLPKSLNGVHPWVPIVKPLTMEPLMGAAEGIMLAMASEFITVAAPVETELEIKKSRFICALAPARSEEEARAFIARQVSLHPKARHHCTAFVLGADAAVQRSNDDGEPSGTAGRPMLDVLLQEKLTDVVAVVIRYFGGVLLGASGLIRAYGNAVSEGVQAAERARYALRQEIIVVLDYQHGPSFEAECHSCGWTVVNVGYGEHVTLTFAVPPEEVGQAKARLADLTSGAADPQLGETLYARA